MTPTLSREVAIEPARTALLFVDVQKYNCTCDGGEYAHLSAVEKEARYAYFFRTLKERALPNMVLLQEACRRGGIEVTYTMVESLTADGRDRSLDYKITGFHVPKGSADAKMLDELAPTDACATQSAERHEWSLRNNRGYCRQVTTAALLEEIARLTETR